MKKIKDTKVGQWLKEKAPAVLNIVGDLLPDQGYLGIVKNLLSSDPDVTPEQEAEFEQIAFELEAADRASARNREIEIAKATGKTDWMMILTGIVGLFSFMFTIYAVVYIDDVRENELFIHLMGMIEGVVIGNIFAYYYGASVKKDK
jgi:hypothetical protein|tara:strand:+ start:963 stop:1403 length:441 start_codon:yes stop_codon:yes gene_type:complete